MALVEATPNGGLVREAVWPKFPVLGRIRQIGLMLSPCLPTSVGISKCNLMGILTSYDEMASHRGGMTFGFRPYWFQSGVKQFLCDEDRCTFFLPHGRVECLDLKHGDHISLVNATIEMNRHDSGYKWHVTADSFPTTLVGVHAKREDVLKTIDLFAGLTNWSMTAKAMGLHPCVSIEKDEQIGEVGAMNLKTPFWTADDFVKHWENDFGKTYHHVDIMLLADVQNEFIREPLSHYRSGMLVGSPPCPPWSRLSSMLGLADSRGRLIMTVADIAQFLGSRIVALENVANILNHPDWKAVVEHFHHRGYALIFSGADPLDGFLPVKRTRASLIFARYDFPVGPIPESMHLGTWDGNISAQSMGVIHRPDSEDDAIFKSLTAITDEHLQMLNDPNFLTSEMAMKVARGLTVMESRAQGGHRPLPCPTARYASPETLSEQTLRDHKLSMIVLKQGAEFRWFSPFEFAIGLGMNIHTILPLDRKLAYMMVGNTIAPLHAAVNINRALCCIASEFCKARPVSWLVQSFAKRQIPLHKCTIQHDEAVMWMAENRVPTLASLVEKVMNEPIVDFPQSTQHIESKPTVEVADQEPACKHRKLEHVTDLSTVMVLHAESDFVKYTFSQEASMRQIFDEIACDHFMVVLMPQHEVPCSPDMTNHLIKTIECKVSIKLKLNGGHPKKFLPGVDLVSMGDVFPCWFFEARGIECHECSPDIKIGELDDLRGKDSVILILPICESPNQHVKHVHDLVGLWIKVGKMGDLHQVWMSHDQTFECLKKRYAIQGYESHAFVNNCEQPDTRSLKHINDVIEIRQIPQSIGDTMNALMDDDTMIDEQDRHFLADPTTVVLHFRSQPCPIDMWQAELQQAQASLIVPENHVVITISAIGWKQVMVVCKGVAIRSVVAKLLGCDDGIQGMFYKGFPIDRNMQCNKAMVIDVQMMNKFIFMKFNMHSQIFAIRVKPFHKGIDCKAQLASYLGIPIGVLRLFDGFHQIHDDTSVWKVKGIVAARTFPLAGGIKQPAAVEDNVEMWIKSPNNGKMSVVSFPQHESLACLHNEVFPGLPVGKLFCDGQMIDEHETRGKFSKRILVSRYFPLRGGAKADGKHKPSNAVKAIDFVSEQLENRGVPKSECTERAKKIVSSLGTDFIVKIMDTDDSWNQLKSEASKNMVRLILPAELKAWQQMKRAEQKVEKSQPKKMSSPALHPRDLILKVSDFKADGKPMKLITEDAIKPDCSGVCLMAPNGAKNFLPAKRLSPDGLAIVTLGILSNSDPQIQCVASNVGGEDFIIRGNLYQFGDTQVVHCPSCPTAVVQEVASSVVEVIVGRDCPWWKIATADVITAIARLGTRANVRDVILGQWKFKAYDTNRALVNHDKAAHIHGYIRVKDGGLDELLMASGQQSIFFNTRVNGGGKDDRFSFVPLPELSLEEAKCKAQTLQCSLGIVKGKGHYTLRCRREHYRKIMKQLNPDFIAGDSSDDETGLTMKFRLEGVNFQTTAHELSAAFKTLNWRAKAIRATGAAAWLIMAEAPPPNYQFTLNNQLVVVKDVIPKTPLHQFLVSKPVVPNPDQVTAPGQSVPGPVSTRLGQLESEMDQKIQKIIDKQMHEANTKIDRLEASMKLQEEGQKELREGFDQQKSELANVSSKISNVASELQNTQSSMLSSFEALIKAEMNNLHQRLATERESSEEKRRRKE